jgi:hypothetical protein
MNIDRLLSFTEWAIALVNCFHDFVNFVLQSIKGFFFQNNAFCCTKTSLVAKTQSPCLTPPNIIVSPHFAHNGMEALPFKKVLIIGNTTWFYVVSSRMSGVSSTIGLWMRSVDSGVVSTLTMQATNKMVTELVAKIIKNHPPIVIDYLSINSIF